MELSLDGEGGKNGFSMHSINRQARKQALHDEGFNPFREMLRTSASTTSSKLSGEDRYLEESDGVEPQRKKIQGKSHGLGIFEHIATKYQSSRHLVHKQLLYQMGVDVCLPDETDSIQCLTNKGTCPSSQNRIKASSKFDQIPKDKTSPKPASNLWADDTAIWKTGSEKLGVAVNIFRPKENSEEVEAENHPNFNIRTVYDDMQRWKLHHNGTDQNRLESSGEWLSPTAKQQVCYSSRVTNTVVDDLQRSQLRKKEINGVSATQDVGQLKLQQASLSVKSSNEPSELIAHRTNDSSATSDADYLMWRLGLNSIREACYTFLLLLLPPILTLCGVKAPPWTYLFLNLVATIPLAGILSYATEEIALVAAGCLRRLLCVRFTSKLSRQVVIPCSFAALITTVDANLLPLSVVSSSTDTTTDLFGDLEAATFVASATILADVLTTTLSTPGGDQTGSSDDRRSLKELFSNKGIALLMFLVEGSIAFSIISVAYFMYWYCLKDPIPANRNCHAEHCLEIDCRWRECGTPDCKKRHCPKKQRRLLAAISSVLSQALFAYLRDEPDSSWGLLFGLFGGGVILTIGTIRMGISNYKLAGRPIYTIIGTVWAIIIWIGCYFVVQKIPGISRADVLLLPSVAVSFASLEVLATLCYAVNQYNPDWDSGNSGPLLPTYAQDITTSNSTGTSAQPRPSEPRDRTNGSAQGSSPGSTPTTITNTQQDQTPGQSVQNAAQKYERREAENPSTIFNAYPQQAHFRP